MLEMIPGKSGFSNPPTPQILTVISGCEGGGYHPAITLSRMLHNDFYSVRLLCDQETTSAAVESGIPSYILPATCSAGNFYIGKINQLLKDRARIYEKTENPLVVWAEKAAAILQNDNDFPPPNLIISSLLCQPLASLLGRQFGVPWIFVNPAFSYLAHSHCNWQLDFSLTGAEMYQHWLLPFTQKADLIVHATDPLFDNSDPIVSEKEFYIGPLFHEQKPPPTLPTLPEDCPCVIASISTSPQPREQQLLERIIEAGDVIRHPVILTTTKSSPLCTIFRLT